MPLCEHEGGGWSASTFLAGETDQLMNKLDFEPASIAQNLLFKKFRVLVTGDKKKLPVAYRQVNL